MQVMSFNIWSDAPRNASWTRRREVIAQILGRPELDLVGLQEVTWPMIHDLHKRLPDFRWVATGRDDGAEAGECTPIFYRKARFTLAEHGHFWLSDTCGEASRGWDAMCRRIVTWARLVDNETGQAVIHLNTHLDHFGRKARVLGSLLLLRKVDELANGAPAIVTGDFNCRESSAPYLLLTGKVPFNDKGKDTGALRDTRYDSAQAPEGPRKTYRGLLSMLGLGRIDYIFVKNGLRTLRHVVLEDGAGASDHRPVLAEVSFVPTAESGTER